METLTIGNRKVVLTWASGRKRLKERIILLRCPTTLATVVDTRITFSTKHERIFTGFTGLFHGRGFCFHDHFISNPYRRVQIDGTTTVRLGGS